VLANTAAKPIERWRSRAAARQQENTQIVRLLAENRPPRLATTEARRNSSERQYHKSDAVLPLQEIEIDLPLAEIYEAVEFSAKPEEDEAE
jgi:hypothetical protein